MSDLFLKDINKVYPGGAQAVFDFNLKVRERDFIVLVGPSACGKSTLLRMIAGLEDVTSGELFLDGKMINGLDTKERDIAMVFQSQPLYPQLTVYDNMAYGLKIRKVPQEIIDEKVKTAAEVLGITDCLSRKPKNLSGGQRQRVALGRAIVREPALFLFDEPFSNLDANLRVQMQSEIRKLHARLKTPFLYATSDPLEAISLGTRIVVMKDGFIQQIDTPRNLYDYPVNLFVAEFFGNPKMNVFQNATLKQAAGQISVNFEGNEILLPNSVVNRVKNIDEYLNTDKKIVLGIRPEDIHGESVAAEHVYLFDGFTQAAMLERDEHYEQIPENEESASFVPLTPQEMTAKIQASKGTKEKKRKKPN